MPRLSGTVLAEPPSFGFVQLLAEGILLLQLALRKHVFQRLQLISISRSSGERHHKPQSVLQVSGTRFSNQNVGRHFRIPENHPRQPLRRPRFKVPLSQRCQQERRGIDASSPPSKMREPRIAEQRELTCEPRRRDILSNFGHGEHRRRQSVDVHQPAAEASRASSTAFQHREIRLRHAQALRCLFLAPTALDSGLPKLFVHGCIITCIVILRGKITSSERLHFSGGLPLLHFPLASHPPFRTTITASVPSRAMHPILLAAFFAASPTVLAACAFSIALFFVGLWAAKDAIAAAHGLDKIVALSNLCFAIPLAAFSAEHLFSASALEQLVPRFMPWRLFWAYFVGVALISAALSIATKIAVRWSGLFFGIMMFSFVAMIHLPGAIAAPHNRIVRTIVFREMSFGAGGWLLAAAAANGWSGPAKRALFTVGRILVAITAIVFGVEHFYHPLGLPGVPLIKEMPAWLPARASIDYITGAALLLAGLCFLLDLKTRKVASWLGAWLLLLVIAIYGPVLIFALGTPADAVQVEGINYFTDTLLFTAVILALSAASRVSVETPALHPDPQAEAGVASGN